MSDKTKVIFRKWNKEQGGEVIAVFPELPGDFNPYRTCLSYEHVGQHGAITLNFSSWTLPASPAEYADLAKELESIGYNLDIRKRSSGKDLQARIKAVGQ